MRKVDVMVLLVFLTLIGTFSISAVNAQTNLRIDGLGSKDAHNDTFEPLFIWVEILNPDSSGHFYKVRIDFEGSTIDQNGYVPAGERDVVYFTVTPYVTGNATITATLWQDAYGGGDGLEQRTKNVTIEKNYMQVQIENSNHTVQSLQAENARLDTMVNNLAYGIVSLVILVFVVAFTIWWLDKRRFNQRYVQTNADTENS